MGVAGIALGLAPLMMLAYRAAPVVARVGPQVLLDPRILPGLPAILAFAVLLGRSGYRHVTMALRAPALLVAFVNHRAGVRPRDWPVTADELLSMPGHPPALGLAFAKAADTGERDLASALLAQAPIRLRLEGALFHALVLGDTVTARQLLALDGATLPRRLWRLLSPELGRLSWAAVQLVEGDRHAGEVGLARWHRHFRFYRRSPHYVASLWATDAMNRRLPTGVSTG